MHEKAWIFSKYNLSRQQISCSGRSQFFTTVLRFCTTPLPSLFFSGKCDVCLLEPTRWVTIADLLTTESLISMFLVLEPDASAAFASQSCLWFSFLCLVCISNSDKLFVTGRLKCWNRLSWHPQIKPGGDWNTPQDNTQASRKLSIRCLNLPTFHPFSPS